MRLVAPLASIEQNGMWLAFSGGTSLSKVYDLIHRFSEDLDFEVIVPVGGNTPPARRAFRREPVADLLRHCGPEVKAKDPLPVGAGRQPRLRQGGDFAATAEDAAGGCDGCARHKLLAPARRIAE